MCACVCVCVCKCVCVLVCVCVCVSVCVCKINSILVACCKVNEEANVNRKHKLNTNILRMDPYIIMYSQMAVNRSSADGYRTRSVDETH